MIFITICNILGEQYNAASLCIPKSDLYKLQKRFEHMRAP